MKLWLASERFGRDGRMWVSHDGGERFVLSPAAYPSVQSALEDWFGFVEAVAGQAGQRHEDACNLDVVAVLPRCSQALCASAYGNRELRVHQQEGGARSDDRTILMYQGASDRFLGPGDVFPAQDIDQALDLEAEIAVAVEDVPMGVTAREASRFIRLVLGMNDFTYRTLIRNEKTSGFGFIQGKPLKALSAFAATPEALGRHWVDGRLDATLVATCNGQMIGRVPTLGMEWSFPELVAHAAATRPLAAGTLISSGTVSSPAAEGAASLIELRGLQSKRGQPRSPFLVQGDRVDLRFLGKDGSSLFGPLYNGVG
jgi:fumarylacetoacetate (FAA) hydrolase